MIRKPKEVREENGVQEENSCMCMATALRISLKSIHPPWWDRTQSNGWELAERMKINPISQRAQVARGDSLVPVFFVKNVEPAKMARRDILESTKNTIT